MLASRQLSLEWLHGLQPRSEKVHPSRSGSRRTTAGKSSVALGVPFASTHADGSLPPSQREVLATIVRSGPLRLSELAAEEGINPTMLSRILGHLETAALVTRRPDEADARVVHLAATEKGRALHEEMRNERTDALFYALGKLPADQRRVDHRGPPGAGNTRRVSEDPRSVNVHASARRTFSSLSNPNYRKFFFGQTTSLIGTWMQTTAQSWLVFTLTHSATDIGFVVALQTLPVLILGPYGGVIADRVDKRRLMIGLQSMMGLQAAALARPVNPSRGDLPRRLPARRGPRPQQRVRKSLTSGVRLGDGRSRQSSKRRQLELHDEQRCSRGRSRNRGRAHRLGRRRVVLRPQRLEFHRRGRVAGRDGSIDAESEHADDSSEGSARRGLSLRRQDAQTGDSPRHDGAGGHVGLRVPSHAPHRRRKSLSRQFRDVRTVAGRHGRGRRHRRTLDGRARKDGLASPVSCGARLWSLHDLRCLGSACSGSSSSRSRSSDLPA